MEKEYIVGTDFGHGETSSWVVPLKLTTGTEYGEALKLKATNKVSERSYYSVIYSMPDGSFAIDNLRGNLISGFKDKISVLDQPQNAIKRKAYTEYIKQIYKRLLKHNTMLKTDGNGNTNFYLCIACPTKWNQEEKDAYIQFFNEALSEFGVEVMWVINESDAAYFTHGSIGKYANKCILIIDYGSSTIDYTVIYQGKKISDDNWSNRLGASNIEESILDESRKTSGYQEIAENTISKLAETGDNHIDINSSIKFEIRKAKEHSVTYGQYPSLEVNCNLIGKHTNYAHTAEFRAEKKKYKFEIECQIDQAIEKYQNKVIDDFSLLNQRIREKIGDKDIDCVILSGGACQMPWVSDAVNEVFKPLQVELDNHASFVVAKGIALYAKAQMKALVKLQNTLQSVDFKETYKQADLKATLMATEELFPPILEEIEGSTDLTCNEIFSKIAKFFDGLNSLNMDYKNLLTKCINDELTIKISSYIKSAIKEVFGIEVDTSDVKSKIDAQVMDFKDGTFTKEGKCGRIIYELLADATGPHFFTKFDLEKRRRIDERRGIVRQCKSKFFTSNPFGVVYEEKALNAIAEEVKTISISEAVKIFYKKQLFNTTFKNSESN